MSAERGETITTATKSLIVAVGAAIAAGLIALYVVGFLLDQPGTVAASTSQGSTNLTLMTVPSIGFGQKPDWVSYLIKDTAGNWVHSTYFQVPAHSTIHVTILNYDGASGLRNPFFGQPRGIVGEMTVNGTPVPSLYPPLASHTWTVPSLNISVPLEGVPGGITALCAAAPCPLSAPHMTVKFTIRTGNPGTFRWQCIVPCAAGFPYGFGGPMQTIGYMDGYLKVV